MNARLVEASVLLGASALTVWLYGCAREGSAAELRERLMQASGPRLYWAAVDASRWPGAWSYDEAAREAVMQHLRCDPYSRRCCLLLGPFLPAHRQEVWQILCTEIQSIREDRAYDALRVLPRMGAPVPEPIVDDLWNWCVRLDRSSSKQLLAEMFVVGIESTAAGKQLLLRKWQAASDAERLQLVALGITDPERRWQSAAR